ncbi:MAG: hypothetical protein LBC68_10310 [Prevotellaceae bacterium]|jgi:hypothetical protein|nr:hypothetical protein [Prevotellaceae bacterium]
MKEECNCNNNPNCDKCNGTGHIEVPEYPQVFADIFNSIMNVSKIVENAKKPATASEASNNRH